MHNRQAEMRLEMNYPLMRGDGMGEEYQKTVREYVAKVMLERGWSQAEIGKRVGVAQSTIQRALDPDYPHKTKATLLFEIERASGVPLPPEISPGGLFDRGRDYEPPSNGRPFMGSKNPRSQELRPVYASAHGGDGEQILAPGEVVEWRAPPQRWDSVKGLYGFYVVGDSMEPRINAGEMVWIHPHRKPAPGQEAVFIRRAGVAGETPIMVKLYVRATSAFWVVKQFNPSKEFQLRRDEWDCQLIVDIDLNR